MAKKKSKLINNEKLLRPIEWAKEDGIDHHLFLHWNTLVTKKEYELLKQKVYRTR